MLNFKECNAWIIGLRKLDTNLIYFLMLLGGSVHKEFFGLQGEDKVRHDGTVTAAAAAAGLGLSGGKLKSPLSLALVSLLSPPRGRLFFCTAYLLIDCPQGLGSATEHSSIRYRVGRL